MPLLTLDERHNEVELVGWQRSCFHIHHIPGFLPASLFVAGQTGLAGQVPGIRAAVRGRGFIQGIEFERGEVAGHVCAAC